MYFYALKIALPQRFRKHYTNYVESLQEVDDHRHSKGFTLIRPELAVSQCLEAVRL